jgi:hypothetical protein
MIPNIDNWRCANELIKQYGDQGRHRSRRAC